MNAFVYTGTPRLVANRHRVITTNTAHWEFSIRELGSTNIPLPGVLPELLLTS